MQSTLREMFQRQAVRSDAEPQRHDNQLISNHQPVADAASVDDAVHVAVVSPPHLHSPSGSDTDDAVGDDDAAGFTTTPCVAVQHGALPRVVYVPIMTIDGKSFFTLRRDVKCLQLFVGGSPYIGAGYEALQHTNVIDQLREMRHTEFLTRVTVDATNAKTHNKFRHGSMRLKILQLPDYVTIRAPDVHDVMGVDVTVALTKGNSPLQLELTDDCLTYLRSAMLAQIASGTVVRKRDYEKPDNVEEKGVSYSIARDRYIAKRKNSTTKRFDSFVTPSKQEAVDFHSTGIRAERTPVRRKCDVKCEGSDNE